MQNCLAFFGKVCYNISNSRLMFKTTTQSGKCSKAAANSVLGHLLSKFVNYVNHNKEHFIPGKPLFILQPRRAIFGAILWYNQCTPAWRNW